MTYRKPIIILSIALSLFISMTNSFAAKLPLEFTSIPTIRNMIPQATQIIRFTIKNNSSTTLPISIGGISTPISLSAVAGDNDCRSTLGAGLQCNIRLSIRPTAAGTISQTLSIDYQGRFPLTTAIRVNVSSVSVLKLKHLNSSSISNFVGVDYAPAHYPQGDPRNDEDEANVIPELKQLQAAGYNVIRMYGEPAKTWIAVIKAAYNQNMQVIYQLATCESDLSGNCVEISNTFAALLATEITKLQNVITQVGTSVFQKVVPLVLIGNEIYFTQGSQSNINDLLSAASQTRAITDPLNIPASISLQADVWISSSQAIQTDLNNLVAALSTNVPIGINVYPFQWVVPVANSVTGTTPHSINWYMSGLNYPSNSVMISESGWATAGNYFVGANNTTGSITNSEAYFPMLYAYTKNTYPLLAFMAFDTPTKTSNPNLTSENYYGVFDDECNLKGGSSPLNLLANTLYNGTAQCSSSNTLFTFAGGSNTAQPPFSIQYTHGGFTYLVSVPTADRTQESVTPWPTVTLSAGDVVTLVSTSSTCTNTVATASSTHSGGTWMNPGTTGTGSGNCNAVNWVNGGQTVFMPANF